MITQVAFFNRVHSTLVQFDKFVVGLSGGADSLGLILLLDEYARESGKKVYACIVDHKLRAESSTEILPTIEILKKRGIDYSVQVWEHEAEISGSIENRARIARYDLLYRYCKSVGSEVLMTAHHSLDQWETFFMRLARGSSLKGLAAIRPVSKFKDITLVRPLLYFPPLEIKETLKDRFGISDYVQDPSNELPKFERVRWRKSYDAIAENYGLDIDNVSMTVTRLQQADSCLAELARHYMRQLFDGEYLHVRDLAKLHIELRMRVIGCVVEAVLGAERLIAYGLLSRVATEICEKDFVATNLAGLVFRRDRTKNVKVYKEVRNQKSQDKHPPGMAAPPMH